MKSGKIANRCALVVVAAAVAFFGCLDADPLFPGGKSADVSVELVYVTGEGSSDKRVEIDSIRIAIHDITDDPWTGTPNQFELAAEETSPVRYDDATGVHYLGTLRVDLSDQRTYRVLAFISLAGEGANYQGERTIQLAPNDRSSVTLVMTDADDMAPGSFDLAVPKTIGYKGKTVDIPIVLTNSDTLGGIQFQFEFDRDILETVSGIRVDPASRLFVGGGEGDPSRIYSHLASTDSTARVVVVDLAPDGGEEPSELLRPIPPGNDLLLSLVVTLSDSLTSIPDTMDLLLSDVFFSTPSGSSDIAVSEPTGGILIIAE